MSGEHVSKNNIKVIVCNSINYILFTHVKKKIGPINTLHKDKPDSRFAR